MNFILTALMALLVLACSDQVPSESAKPEHTLVFWTDDGVEGDYGKIAGNAPSEFDPPIGKRDQLVQAVNKCVGSYSVNREYSHMTIVSVDTQKLGLSRNEIVQCDKGRFAGQFDAAFGAPEAFETFDDMLFTQFHDYSR